MNIHSQFLMCFDCHNNCYRSHCSIQALSNQSWNSLVAIRAKSNQKHKKKTNQVYLHIDVIAQIFQIQRLCATAAIHLSRRRNYKLNRFLYKEINTTQNKKKRKIKFSTLIQIRIVFSVHFYSLSCKRFSTTQYSAYVDILSNINNNNKKHTQENIYKYIFNRVSRKYELVGECSKYTQSKKKKINGKEKKQPHIISVDIN